MNKLRIPSGLLLGLAGLVIFASLFSNIDLMVDLPTYFKPEYYNQFSPLILCALLINAGVFIILKHKRTNFSLAMFGYTALEELLFRAIGLSQNLWPTWLIISFLLLGGICVFLAHRNPYKLKALSIRDLIVSLAFGFFESFILPNYIL